MVSNIRESEIRKQVYLIGELGPRRGVPALFQYLPNQAEKINMEALGTVIHCLCTRGSPWVATFYKSIRKKGCCPKMIRKDILSILKKTHTLGGPSSMPEVFRSHRAAIGKASIVINSRQELGINYEQRTLLAKLHDLYAYHGPIDLAIHFDCERVYIYGLALIAAWCARYAATVKITASHLDTWKELVLQILFKTIATWSLLYTIPKTLLP